MLLSLFFLEDTSDNLPDGQGCVGVSMAINEKHLAKKLQDVAPQFLWKHTPDRYSGGVPDRHVLLRGTPKTAVVELKHYAHPVPPRNCKVKLQKRQALWLEEWRREGGNAFLLVGFESNKHVAIFSEKFKRIFSSGMTREEILKVLVPIEDVAAKLQELMQ